MLMFYLNREVLICIWQCFHIPGRSVSLSPLSSPVRSAPISRLLLLLQNLLGASGMIKKSAHYTVLSKTNLNLGERGAVRPAGPQAAADSFQEAGSSLWGEPQSLPGGPGHRAWGTHGAAAGAGAPGVTTASGIIVTSSGKFPPNVRRGGSSSKQLGK